MKVIILGSTGMVGKSVLVECIEDKQVEEILLINRTPVNIRHHKIKEIIQKDFFNLSVDQDQLKNYNACFFCMGVSSVGMTEDQYRSVTYDLTLAFANRLLSANPNLVFCYVSGAGTDSSEKGRMMWARVKGRTENALLAMPFKASYMFRPGYIQPLKGVKAKSSLVNVLYLLFTPLYYLLRPFQGLVTNSVSLARAMINVVRLGYNQRILEIKDINVLAASR